MTLQDWKLGHLDTSFFGPYMAKHEHVVASVEHGNHETWILFDFGAAANCCPPDFAPEFLLLQLDERAPPLKSISGQTLNISGGKLVAFEIEKKRLWLNFLWLSCSLQCYFGCETSSKRMQGHIEF